MKTENRLDASLLNPGELDQLADLVNRGRPALVDGQGRRMELPQPIFEMLIHVVQQMQQGRAIVMLPEDETFTTQAAANFLGMSRQHFVGLLESNQVPYHRVGSHRRVYFKDLRDYQRKRDTERRTGMGSLFKKVKEAGVYDADYTGDAR
jgi:excisionase family DNA binding protein